MPILTFVMSSYIEEKQPSQSMAMHGKRGKPCTEDESAVLGDMKGTPRYVKSKSIGFSCKSLQILMRKRGLQCDRLCFIFTPAASLYCSVRRVWLTPLLSLLQCTSVKWTVFTSWQLWLDWFWKTAWHYFVC